MSDEMTPVLEAHTRALSMTLSAIIQVLPATTTAQAAITLAMAKEEQRRHDHSDGISPEVAQARDNFIDAYLGLLSASSKAN